MNAVSLLFLYLNKLLDILFPTECIVCKTPGPDLCASCISDFGWPKPCRKKDRWRTSLWNYRDTNVERLIRSIKNHPNDRIAKIIAKLFSERILNRPSDFTSWIIIPIPVSQKRFRERGYNQSELLARPIAEQFTFPVITRLLVKSQHTKKQGTSSSREERAQNVTGSFAVRNELIIKDKNIILVDDVTTTGSTLSEARKTLLAAGARRVIAWTIAN